mmetsp:Transcript_7143/g.16224  ORF Transcript_7143/g.16224 Transcript_7143/m.16224 type:complete len:334 (+) Transcript_7143:98-1099(+)
MCLSPYCIHKSAEYVIGPCIFTWRMPSCGLRSTRAYCGADPEKSDYLGKTALMEAAERGFMDVVKCLSGKGANLNTTTKQCGTALSLAARRGSAEMVKWMLAEGAHPETPGVEAVTALMEAASEGHLVCVKLLLTKEAEPDKVDYQKRTALMKASRRGHVDVVTMLLAKGADRHKEDSEGTTALDQANRHEHLDVVAELLDEEENAGGWEELKQACQKGSLADVKRFMGRGDDPNRADGFGNIPLVVASIQGHCEIVETLLRKGANVDKSDGEACTALSAAFDAGHEEIVKNLLDKPFHRSNLEVVKYLFEKVGLPMLLPPADMDLRNFHKYP